MDQRRGRRGNGDGLDGTSSRVAVVAPGKRTRVEQALESQPPRAQRAAAGHAASGSAAGEPHQPTFADPFSWLDEPEPEVAEESSPWSFDLADRRGLDDSPGHRDADFGALQLASDDALGASSSLQGPTKSHATAAALAITPSTPLPQIAAQLQDLSDDELRERRARLTARLASLRLPPDVRLTIARQRDAIEWLQHQRQLAAGEAPSAHANAPTHDELSEAAPTQGASSLDVGARARLESAGRTGGPADEQQTFVHLSMRGTPEQQGALHRQHGAIATENTAFRAELNQKSLHVAQEMLDASTREIEGALLKYGLTGGAFRLTTAAKQYQRDPESLPQIIAEWRALGGKPERAGALQRGAASQAALAATVARLKAKQEYLDQMDREEEGLPEAQLVWRDSIDPSRTTSSARIELAQEWVLAETEHPILLAFRHPKYGASTSRLGELDSPGAEMEGAVLEQAITKLANILRTKNELFAGRLDPLRLAPVLELTKQRLLVPPGSQRAQLVAELHREATKTPLAEHVLSAISLGLAVLSFVPGVGLPAKVLAEAVSLAIELRAQVSEYKEWHTAGGINNTALDMARSVSAAAPELRPLFLRLAVAGASAASLLQLSRLAVRLERARQLGGATGAADSVDEILKEADALGDSVGVRKLGEQLDAVGGVRGAGVYGQKVYDAADGTKRLTKLNLEKVRDSLKKVLRQPRVRDAKVEAQLSEATADAAACTLKLPSFPAAEGVAKAGAIDVHVELRFKGELSPSAAHGADAGPARYTLTKNNEQQWVANIEIDQHLEPRDVEFIIGHELDEIAELVRRYPAGKPAASFEGEMAAGVMREGATTAQATAHDVANAREIVALHRDYKNLLAQPAGKATANAEARKQTLDRAIEIAGLGEASQIDAKVRLLREAGAPDELLKEVKKVQARRVMSEHSAAHGGKGSLLTENLVDHVLWPHGRNTADFVSQGVNGGHHTERLLAMTESTKEYVFVEVAAKPAAGSVARKFDQYKWAGGGPMPKPGSGRFPTDKNFDVMGWEKSEMPKTTMDDPLVLLREAEDAWRRWLEAGGQSSVAKTGFTAESGNGVQISGYFKGTGSERTPSSVYVEASWF
jgi:hypothetical protein